MEWGWEGLRRDALREPNHEVRHANPPDPEQRIHSQGMRLEISIVHEFGYT